MKRTGWKAAFGISLALLILIFFFLLFLWAAGTLLMTMLSAGLGQPLPEYQSFGEFCSAFLGSPLFWFSLADAALLLLSTAMLLFRKDTKRSGKTP